MQLVPLRHAQFRVPREDPRHPWPVRDRHPGLGGGLYSSKIQLPHKLETAQFQPSNPSSGKLVSKFAAPSVIHLNLSSLRNWFQSLLSNGSNWYRYAWDQICLLIFAPHILFTAYRDTLRALPGPKDMVKPMRRVVGLGIVAYVYYATEGNMFVLVAAFYAFKQGIL
jgi:hypothetical protein